MDKFKANAWEIKKTCEKHGVDTDNLWNDLLRRFRMSSVERASGFKKRSGVKAVALFEFALAAKVMTVGTTLGFFAKAIAGSIGFECSAMYRFLQSDKVNWRLAFYDLSKQLRGPAVKSAADVGNAGPVDERRRPTSLIVDDSTINKTGRRIEGASKVYDHTTSRYVLGGNLLSLAWFDGLACRFLDLALVKESVKSLKKVKGKFHKRRDPASPGAQRKAEMSEDKISLAIKMLKRAVRNGFIPEYVQTDSWFTCLKLVKAVRGLANGTVHFLGMVKFGGRKFELNGKPFTLANLKKLGVPKESRCRRFKSRYYQMDCVLPGLGEVRIFVSRFAGSKKCVALMTTDLTMSYVKAIETYMIRWNIEICFKEVKQLLGLQKCQARDFDSQIAHFTLVFMAHALLVDLKVREEYKTLGILFESLTEQRRAVSVTERIIGAFEEFLRAAAETMGGIDKATLADILESEMYDVFKKIILGTTIDYQGEMEFDATS